MKTPMQEVYENFNTMSDADFKSWMLNTNLLEEEKRLKELARKASPWDWEVEETETDLIFKVNGMQVYRSTKAPSKPKSNG